MARSTKTFISPGVFTNEVDVSFLPAAVGQIGAAIIGVAEKGPAMVPITVKTYSEYANIFGDLDPKYYMGYAARAYLKNAGTANIVRVLGPSGCTNNGAAVNPGYTADSLWAVIGVTGSTAYLHATIEITASSDLVIADLPNDLFMVQISSSANNLSYAYTTASFLTSSEFYIKKVLNTDPTLFKTKGYFLRDVYDYQFFKQGRTTVGMGNSSYSSASYALTNFGFSFNSGSTPWIKSQLFGGSSEYNLFKIHTLGHGEAENGRLKIAIRNIKISPIPTLDEHGLFDLEVRMFGDTDKTPTVYEQHIGLSLDPSSPDYIVKRIGDRHWEFNTAKDKMISYGNYPNVSKLIRVEMSVADVIPDSALPWGFVGLEKPSMGFADGVVTVADTLGDLPYVSNLYDKETQSEIRDWIHWGVEFELSGSIIARLSKLPTMTGSDTAFSLRFVSGSDGTATPGTSLAGLCYKSTNEVMCQKAPGDSTTHTTLEPKYAQFVVPVAFGFDGWDRRTQDVMDNVTQLAATSQIGVQALRRAINIVGDPDFIDINLLAIPGIYTSKVVDYAIDKIENRADAFYIAEFINPTSSATSVATAKTTIKGRSYDSNYAAVYYPGIKVMDPVNNKVVELPSSIAALGAISYNDRVAYPWFAPAGLNRGGLNQDTIGFLVTEAIEWLTAGERDGLYENKVNPIASFPGEGIAIWGQKTLQSKSSALDRINVRRLMIKAKKLIASTTKYLEFEQNNSNTWTRFKQMVNPILSDIQRKNGLEAFKVIMDETTNTPDVIDRNIMAGKIFLKPTRTAEFITLDFIINRSGAVFEG